MRDLARLWNVAPAPFPDRAPETHALDIFQRCKEGAIRMLWVLCTNPATSLPDLARIRATLQKRASLSRTPRRRARA